MAEAAVALAFLAESPMRGLMTGTPGKKEDRIIGITMEAVRPRPLMSSPSMVLVAELGA
jgi:hypothetical protein